MQGKDKGIHVVGLVWDENSIQGKDKVEAKCYAGRWVGIQGKDKGIQGGGNVFRQVGWYPRERQKYSGLWVGIQEGDKDIQVYRWVGHPMGDQDVQKQGSIFKRPTRNIFICFSTICIHFSGDLVSVVLCHDSMFVTSVEQSKVYSFKELWGKFHQIVGSGEP